MRSVVWFITDVVGLVFCITFYSSSIAPNSLPEASRTPSHNFALANKLRVELAAVEGEVNIKVDAIKGTLWRVHPLKIFLKVLAREI